MNLELLNQLLYDYLYDEDDFYEADFSFLTSMNHIITTPRFHLERQRYRTKTKLQTCIGLSHQFLNHLDSRYGEYLEFLLSSGKITIHQKFLKRRAPLSAMTVSEQGKKIDFYPVGSIEDAYTFSHETLHSWNCDEKCLTPTWSLTTELFSILAESLQEDEMKTYQHFYPEYRKNKRNTYYALRLKAMELDFEIQLLEAFQYYGYLDEELLLHIFEEMTPEEREVSYRHFAWIMEHEELDIWLLQRYVIGGVLASYMHQRILQKPARIRQFIELNDYCNEMEFIDILKYLDLELLDEGTVEVSPESLKVLEKSYKAELLSL